MNNSVVQMQTEINITVTEKSYLHLLNYEIEEQLSLHILFGGGVTFALKD